MNLRTELASMGVRYIIAPIIMNIRQTSDTPIDEDSCFFHSKLSKLDVRFSGIIFHYFFIFLYFSIYRGAIIMSSKVFKKKD